MEQQPLPGAGTALTMGILSIVLTLFCCGPIGAIFSIIGISNARDAERLHAQQPGEFTGYENAKTGKILSYIGIAIALIEIVMCIVFFGVIFALFSSGEFENFY